MAEAAARVVDGDRQEILRLGIPLQHFLHENEVEPAAKLEADLLEQPNALETERHLRISMAFGSLLFVMSVFIP
jgi:hypothetical protein